MTWNSAHSIPLVTVTLIAGIVVWFLLLADIKAPPQSDEATQLQRDIERFSHDSDGRTYTRLLHVKNGDSLARIEKLFGTRLESVADNSGLLRIFREFMAKDPSRYPDGFENADTFKEFCCTQPGRITFQFREGRVVNFDANNYRDLLDYK